MLASAAQSDSKILCRVWYDCGLGDYRIAGGKGEKAVRNWKIEIWQRLQAVVDQAWRASRLHLESAGTTSDYKQPFGRHAHHDRGAGAARLSRRTCICDAQRPSRYGVAESGDRGSGIPADSTTYVLSPKNGKNELQKQERAKRLGIKTTQRRQASDGHSDLASQDLADWVQVTWCLCLQRPCIYSCELHYGGLHRPPAPAPTQ